MGNEREWWGEEDMWKEEAILREKKGAWQEM